MLLDSRPGGAVAELLDIRGDRHSVDVVQRQATALAPVEELRDHAGVCRAGVAVGDAGSEEFDEAAAGALASATNNGRQLFKARRSKADGGVSASVSRISFGI
jgi:hypothetical protein